MQLTRLENEGEEYREKRAELRRREHELIAQVEAVAALRRELTDATPVADYEFVEGPRDLADGDAPTGRVKLSQLFTAPDRPLLIYHFMFGKAQSEPCPMCSMWIDGFNAYLPHLSRNLDFAVAAAAEPRALRDWARERGWDNLRLLSCAESIFKYDLGSEDADGHQFPRVSVFTRAESGGVRHFYTASPQTAEDTYERGIDLLNPVWHLLDLTPHGRGAWYPSLS